MSADTKPEMKVTRERFVEMTCLEPDDDDLDRCNCPLAGKIGPLMCGVCEHNLPRFMCARHTY